MKHARIQFDGQVHTVTVENDQRLRLADGRVVDADQV
ncbi:2-hydroxyhepta-2,4-diene-1,7-dioate isomerase, partial [Pseudomonas soli]|nr:2-hydroxyhepta-2,4-diene-1,7-dioate isomerase [Pseudomonas soli]